MSYWTTPDLTGVLRTLSIDLIGFILLMCVIMAAFYLLYVLFCPTESEREAAAKIALHDIANGRHLSITPDEAAERIGIVRPPFPPPPPAPVRKKGLAIDDEEIMELIYQHASAIDGDQLKLYCFTRPQLIRAVRKVIAFNDAV